MSHDRLMSIVLNDTTGSAGTFRGPEVDSYWGLCIQHRAIVRRLSPRCGFPPASWLQTDG